MVRGGEKRDERGGRGRRDGKGIGMEGGVERGLGRKGRVWNGRGEKGGEEGLGGRGK